MHIAFSPVLLGTGEHLFGGLDMIELGYECSSHIATEKATHAVFTKRG